MTFSQYWWAVFGTAGALWIAGYLLGKALWPTLKRHRWVIGDWDE